MSPIVAKRILPKDEAEPGLYNPDRTPWVIGLGAAGSNPATKYFSAVMGRQVSKTEFLLNDIGHTFDDDPRPCLYVGPTEKNVQRISTGRVTKMIRAIPSLRDALAKGQRTFAGKENPVWCRAFLLLY